MGNFQIHPLSMVIIFDIVSRTGLAIKKLMKNLVKLSQITRSYGISFNVAPFNENSPRFPFAQL
jgi:hypothetical protein